VSTDGGQHGRPALVAARKRLGMNQENAAEALQVSPTTWGRWERGEQDIRPAYRKRMVEVFGVNPDEVERWISGCEQPTPFPWATAWDQNSTLAATVETTTKLWRWDVDPARRQMLATLPFVPAFFSEWLLGWTLDPHVESRAHRGHGVSVGMEDVHRLRDARLAFAQMDQQFGGGLVRPAVADFLDTQVTPLLNGSYNDKVGAELMTAASGLSKLAGWVSYDQLKHGLAQIHYGQALRLAKAAGDPLAGALVLADLAQQATHFRQPQWAIRLARAAQHASEQAHAGPRTQARVLLREARATALLVEMSETRDTHTARRAEHLLSEAENAFGQATGSDEDPVWISDMNPTELAAGVSRAWRMIGDHKRAADSADQVLHGGGTASRRSVQLSKIHRARAVLGLGELDEALSLGRSAVPMVNRLTSARAAEHIKAFDAELDPYAAEPQVRDWRDYLRTELQTAA
jgi:transcriptional regulator with XRE-family HTH domain